MLRSASAKVLNAVQADCAGGEQILVQYREDELALQTLNTLPAAQDAAQLIQPTLQYGQRTGGTDKGYGGHSSQQGNGGCLEACRKAVQHTAGNADGYRKA